MNATENFLMKRGREEARTRKKQSKQVEVKLLREKEIDGQLFTPYKRKNKRLQARNYLDAE